MKKPFRQKYFAKWWNDAHNRVMFNFWAKKRVYLDYASATPMRDEARAAVEQAESFFGNPGAIHADGVAAKKLLHSSRERIARELAVKAREVIFVSGGTEANNIAILGVARKREISTDVPRGETLQGTHWIVSAIEHPSVLACFGEIERLGGEVTFVDPDARGIISAAEVAKALRPETVLVSVGWANSEIGIIQPLREISRAIAVYEKEQKNCGSQTSTRTGKSDFPILLHSDLGQAPLYLSPHVHTLGVDIATLDAGKLYGPRGIGALYLSNRVELAPIIFGGSQERGLRAGTENVGLAAGFAEACVCAGVDREKEHRRLRSLRDMLTREILAAVPECVVNGDPEYSLPHILNVSVPDISPEYVTLALDKQGISISTKSACREGEEGISHVVAALTSHNTDGWRAHTTLRLSLGRDTTDSAVALAARAVIAAVRQS